VLPAAMPEENPMRLRALAFPIAAALAASPVCAHTETHETKKQAIDYSKAEEHPFGRAADPQRAARTIDVDMSDAMRFTPAEITVRRGEIVRFRVKNSGKLLHEMVLGRKKDLERHAELMKKHPGMEHDEPHMVHVDPGKSGEIGWQFTKSGEFLYGCLIPGHFDSGMKGRIIVTEK
jgi:uncharacterized cupredoxin-like copper-binding protein